MFAVCLDCESIKKYHRYLGVIFKSCCAGCNIASSSYTSKVENLVKNQSTGGCELNLLDAGLVDQLWNVGGRNRDGFAGHTDGCWSYRSDITAWVRGWGRGARCRLHIIRQTSCSLILGDHGGGRGVMQVPGGQWLLGVVLRCNWGALA